ncbi:MAG: phosphatase PAP2 family protein [Myxococcota bacterium]
MADSPPDDAGSRAPRARGPVVRAARFVATHVRSLPAEVTVFLGVGFVVAAVAAGVFAWVAWVVLRGHTQALDEWILQTVISWRTPTLTWLARRVTTLGNGVVLVMVLAVASLFLWLTRHRYSVLLLLVGGGVGSALNLVLKVIFDRPRPDLAEALSQVQSASFPSGHAMASLLVYGSVAYLVGRIQPESRLRHVTWLVAGVLVLLIGLSRIYLSVHYPSDVLAGFLAGVAWLAFVVVGIEGLQVLARVHPEVAAHERDLDRGSPGTRTSPGT